MILDLTPGEMAVLVVCVQSHRTALENDPVRTEHASARAQSFITIDDVLRKCERVLRREVGE